MFFRLKLDKWYCILILITHKHINLIQVDVVIIENLIKKKIRYCCGTVVRMV